MNEIVELVRDVSKQTNLLSFNASLEAVRAGEYGRGFAVVAEEVKNLSNETDRSLKNISSLIHYTVKHIDDISEKVDKLFNIIEKEANAMKQTDESFGFILSLMNESNHQNLEIKKEVEQFVEEINEITKASEKVFESMDELNERISKL